MTNKTALFAGGCFWGVQYHFDKLPGVIKTTVGYTGGHTPNPSYEDVCAKKTDHVEAVEVVYDPDKTDFETLTKLFFEIHDPTQTDGQGPDIGAQYLSVIFYHDDEEKNIAQKLIEILESNGMHIATQLKPATTFWPAEKYHQKYYDKKGSTPYCHVYKKLF